MGDPNMDAADLHCDIQARAFDDFSLWQEHQDQHVLDMEIVQHASHYANDKNWHERSSLADYAWRRVQE